MRLQEKYSEQCFRRIGRYSKEKLAALAEGLEFVSEEAFSKKVTTIKEAYFKETAAPQSEVADETPVEGASDEVTPAMAQYLDALNRWNS